MTLALGHLLCYSLLCGLVVKWKLWNRILWPLRKLYQITSARLAPQKWLCADKRSERATAATNRRLAAKSALPISHGVPEVVTRSQLLRRGRLSITLLAQMLGLAGVRTVSVKPSWTLVASLTQLLVLSGHKLGALVMPNDPKLSHADGRVAPQTR